MTSRAVQAMLAIVMRARLRHASTAALLAISCAKDPSPPASSNFAELAAVLLAPTPRGTLQVLVAIEAPGRDSIEVERTVVDPLERAFAPHVESIESIAWHDRAQIYVTLPAGADPLAAIATLRKAVPLGDLPLDVSPPTLTRADRTGALMFAMIGPEAAGTPTSTADLAAFERVVAVAEAQPGIWSVVRCGETERTLSIEVDLSRLNAFGLDVEQLVEWVEASISAEITETPGIDDLMRVFGSTFGGGVSLRDIATVSSDRRAGRCAVIGSDGEPRPTLRIWGTATAIATTDDALTSAFSSDPIRGRLQIWIPGDAESPTAIVSPATPLADHRADLRLWMARDPKPSWLVHDGSDPAWLLASRGTTLRSFSAAELHDRHVWWPGAPLPVTVRLCGPDLAQLGHTADAFAAGMTNDELLDDVAVWAPRDVPRRVFEIDRAAATRLSVDHRAISRLEPLLLGEPITLRSGLPFELRIGRATSVQLTVRAADGTRVPLATVGTLREAALPTFIFRVDGQRCVDVDLQPMHDADRSKIEASVAPTIVLPSGVTATIVPVPK